MFRDGYSSGFSPEDVPSSESSAEKKKQELLDALDTEAEEIKKNRSLKIVRPSNVDGPMRFVDSAFPALERNLIVRFERTEILRIYNLLRKQGAHAGPQATGKASEVLKRFRERVAQLEADLDVLNEQMYSNVRMLSFEGSDIGHHIVPVAELALPDNGQGADEEDVPYVFLGGIATNHHQQAALAMALGLQGKKVYAVTHPGNDLGLIPEDWAERVRKDGTFHLQAEVLKGVVNALGLKKFHMVGYSTGASVSLEASRDPAFSNAAVQVDAIEPMGLENLGFLDLTHTFWAKEVPNVLGDQEAKLKAMLPGNETAPLNPSAFLADAVALSKEQFTVDGLVKIRPEGKLRLWAMSESPFIDASAVRAKVDAANGLRGGSVEGRIEFHSIKGDTHTMPLTHANGFAGLIAGGAEAVPGAAIDDAALDNSAARALFREVLRSE